MAKRVLVVDDAMIMRMRIKEIARESGWEIAGEAANGEEGLAQYRALRPDLMTLDIVMPKLDGVSMVSALRKDGDQTPVLFLSALGEVTDRVTGLQAGGDDYLVKPYAFAELIARVEALARRR